MNWLLKRVKQKKGFTLVELLIVIIILAVLAAIAVPTYLTMRDRAREAGTEVEMANIATALELYNADNEEYPAVSGWSATLQGGSYMDNVPTSDMWGSDYVFALTTDGYTLTSNGVDKTATTADDIVFSNGQQTGFGKYNTNARGETETSAED